MLFPIKQLRKAWDEGECNGLEFVDETDWIQEYKHQHSSVIFKFNEQYYKWEIARTGSPYTDWYYSYDDYELDTLAECSLTTKATKMIEYWT